jgi:dipeptidyl aminopeptidase/acylaminoacyl peptidase
MRATAAVAVAACLATPCLAADDVERLVELMAKVGFASGPSFSPDGQTIAFVSNVSGLPQVWTVPTAGGYPELVTAFDDPVDEVGWSPDGEWLALSLSPGGGMNSQVYLVKPGGTGPRLLTAGGKSNNWLSDWTRDGRAIAISSNRRTPEAMDAYYVDPRGNHRLVALNRGIGQVADTSRDGRLALVSRLASRGSNDLYLVSVADGREVLLTPHEGPGQFFGVLSADGSMVYLGSNKATDNVALGRVRVTAGTAGDIEVLIAREDAELEGLGIDRDGRQLVQRWNVGGRSEISLYDLAAGAERRLGDLPVDIVGSATFSPDGRLLALSGGGAAAPTDIWILDLAGGGFRQLTRSPHAGVDLAALVRPELVRYAAHDGLPLSGWLYRAQGARGPGAVVMNYHGGPEGQARPGFNSTYQALLLRGISVFTPNVRGSSGFGKKFVNLDNGPLRVNAVRDIRATIDHLLGSGLADPGRIGIMGGSYGGYMVMAGLAEYPGQIAAGADLYGVVNFETFFKNTEPWMAAISTVEYGDPRTQAEMLRELSPLHKVDRVTAPTIVLHGANDTNVPVVEAEQVVESLKKRGVPVKYVLFPDEGHGWRKTKNRITSTVEIVNWFTRYLAGSERKADPHRP